MGSSKEKSPLESIRDFLNDRNCYLKSVSELRSAGKIIGLLRRMLCISFFLMAFVSVIYAWYYSASFFDLFRTGESGKFGIEYLSIIFLWFLYMSVLFLVVYLIYGIHHYIEKKSLKEKMEKVVSGFRNMKKHLTDDAVKFYFRHLEILENLHEKPETIQSSNTDKNDPFAWKESSQ